MRLLLVEDDSMIGEAVLDLLRAEQYAVDWARDGDAVFDLRPKGGRRNENMSTDEEAQLVAPFLARGRATGSLPMEELHTAIRDVPKPVIARVQGFAIGGGNVLATICDLTICSDKAQFGQVGPKMGSVDPGYGTAFLARVVGEKKAREIWYLNRRYSGAEAVAMGLANFCFPHDQLDAEVQKIGEELCERSPTALAIAKRSFNMDTAHQAGIAGLGMYALKLYYDTDESREGVNALKEKRKPEFRKYSK